MSNGQKLNDVHILEDGLTVIPNDGMGDRSFHASPYEHVNEKNSQSIPTRSHGLILNPMKSAVHLLRSQKNPVKSMKSLKMPSFIQAVVAIHHGHKAGHVSVVRTPGPGRLVWWFGRIPRFFLWGFHSHRGTPNSGTLRITWESSSQLIGEKIFQREPTNQDSI